MLAAVNSKNRQYDPFRYMVNGRGLKEQQRETAERERQPMTGDEFEAQLKNSGFPVIDNRKKHNGIG